MTEKKQVGTIDLTPTWAGLLPAMMIVLEFGTLASDKDIVKAELARMAKAADAYNDITRSMKPPKEL